MDHADWVERQIAASKRGKASAADQRRAKEGKGWLAAPDKLNPFQRRAMTILGVVGGGIYNARIQWDTLRWANRCIILGWDGRLSTFDYRGLTDAVLMAHDAAIRFEVRPKMRSLELILHERQPQREGMSMFEGHPTLEQAVERHRTRFPISHHLHFSPESEVASDAA
jgi:hypothetical protein